MSFFSNGLSDKLLSNFFEFSGFCGKNDDVFATGLVCAELALIVCVITELPLPFAFLFECWLTMVELKLSSASDELATEV